MLITFSGLDGAGKTTLISHLAAFLESRGRRVEVRTMYDHVGLYALIRGVRDWIAKRTIRAGAPVSGTRSPQNGATHKGVGVSLNAAVLARVRSPATKRVVLPFDVSALLAYRLYYEKVLRKVLILDRYFYDSIIEATDLVNNENHWRYTRALLRFLPTPDLAVFVDVSPEKAFARKGEYSPKELASRRLKYERMFGVLPQIVILPNEDVETAVANLEATVVARLAP